MTKPAMRAVAALLITVVAAALLLWWNPSGFYLWLKAAHVVAVIAWMAGMLYLPRLFVYHCAAPPGSPQSETFKVMERRLLTAIINPAMIAVWVLGLWLAWDSGLYRSGWLQAKFLLVLVLSGLHGHFSAATRAFAQDRNTHSARYWRIMNEAPAVLMIAIVILVIVKPF
jgi:putative membrane protein